MTKPTFELLISAVQAKTPELFEAMRLNSDAVLVNQCGADSEEETDVHGHRVRTVNSSETGVGASRNLCMQKAGADIVLFADEDIVYDDGYEEKVLTAFKEHPEADMLLFNVLAIEGRRTYYNTDVHRVTRMNCGRFPAYSIAAKREKLLQSGITFSLLFGGGAKYSNGEDSLFLMDCLRAGWNLIAVPVDLGHERERESTWFHGYTEKFFFDRGVLYAFLYGVWAKPLALRFLLVKQKEMCREIPVKEAYRLMKQGIARGKEEQANR